MQYVSEYPQTFISSNKKRSTTVIKKNQVCILSPAALIAKLNICSATCFIALLPAEPPRATSFRVGYMASNLSVAYIKATY